MSFFCSVVYCVLCPVSFVLFLVSFVVVYRTLSIVTVQPQSSQLRNMRHIPLLFLLILSPSLSFPKGFGSKSPKITKFTNSHPPFWSTYSSELTLPRFNEFVENHKFFATSLPGSPQVVRDTLSAGVGPICTTGVPGQKVRALTFWKGLEARCFWDDHQDMKWIDSIDLDVVKGELKSYLDSGEPWTSLGTYQGKETGWSQVTLVDFFDRRPAASLFPLTMGMIDASGARIGPRHTALARQSPGTGIPTHNDMHNWILTLHLPLEGPGGGCGIVVDGAARDWVPGKPSVMDTTFDHSTYHDDPEGGDMFLLMVDFFHPGLEDREVEALTRFMKETNGGGHSFI